MRSAMERLGSPHRRCPCRPTGGDGSRFSKPRLQSNNQGIQGSLTRFEAILIGELAVDNFPERLGLKWNFIGCGFGIANRAVP